MWDIWRSSPPKIQDPRVTWWCREQSFGASRDMWEKLISETAVVVTGLVRASTGTPESHDVLVHLPSVRNIISLIYPLLRHPACHTSPSSPEGKETVRLCKIVLFFFFFNLLDSSNDLSDGSFRAGNIFCYATCNLIAKISMVRWELRVKWENFLSPSGGKL